MANHADILRQLSDPNRAFTQLAVYPAQVLEELSRVWEWEESTGLPIFEDPQHVWKRNVPLSLLSELREKPEGESFIAGMTGDQQSFSVNVAGYLKRDLIGRILLWDLKKLQIVNEHGGIRVTKTNANLLDYDDIYKCQALQVTNGGVKRTNEDMINEINLNSIRGFTGPGTYRCRHPSCTVSGPLMTSTPVVTWGSEAHQSVALTKRFSCSSNNIVYLLHCAACLRQGSWTSYVGESERVVSKNQNFHSRISGHVLQFSNNTLGNKYRGKKSMEQSATSCQRVLQFGAPDPDNITMDPYTHFNFVHSPDNRRYTILDGDYASTRREGILIHQFGDSVYDRVSKTGSLNHDY